MSANKLITKNNEHYNLSSFGAIDASSLFVNHNLIASHDPRKARNSVEGVFFKHMLRMCSNATPLNFVHRGASMASLSFNYISYGADVEVSVNQVNRSHYVVVMPLTGRASVKNRNDVADLDYGSVVVLDPASPFKFEMLPDHSHLAIGIPRQKLHNYLSKHSSGFDAAHFEFQSKPYLAKDIGHSLFDFVNYICKELDKPTTIATHGAFSTAIEESFLTLLSSVLCENGHSHIIESITPEEPLYVQKAEQFMEQHIKDEIMVNDIVSAAGVPARTLYNAYKKYYGVSPMSWLRTRRLRQARLDLLNHEQADTLITEIAHRYQQDHVGRFSRAYFDEFGEYPSDTRKLLKIPV